MGGFKKLGNERGSTSLELAILMPVFLGLVLLIFQVALWWHARQVADVVASEALDKGQVVTGTVSQTEAAAHAAAASVLRDLGGINNVQIDTSNTTQDRVVVEVTGCSPRIIAVEIFSRGRCWLVRSRAEGIVERYLTESERNQ